MEKSSKLESKSSEKQLKHHETLYELFEKRPMPVEHLLITQGLYMRSSALAKILFVNELYQLIINKPGVIVEFGTWLGQNIVLFENLRAIYEPFNQSRRVIGFDTFMGYSSISSVDRQSDVIKTGNYECPTNYREYLEDVLEFHEKNNVLGNIKKHQLIQGDVVNTVPLYFKENKGLSIALAYFDMALYEPTKVCLTAILPFLEKGSVIMLDEFNNIDYPGETIAFKEVFKDMNYSMHKSKYMTDRTYVIME